MSGVLARFAAAAMFAGLLLMGQAAPAEARCEGTVSAVRPDGTPVGWFVTAPENPAAGDPFENERVSWSDTYGYGEHWNTYDLGCGPDAARDPLALAFNAMANLVMEAAKWPVAIIDQIQTWLTGDPFGWFGDWVSTITDPIRDKVWMNFFPLSLTVLGLVLVWQSRRADFSATMSAAGWCLVVLTISVFFLQYPTKAAGAMTQAVQSGKSIASAPFDSGDFPDTLSRHVIYPQWLQGELGSTTSATAKQYGEDLYRAQHYTWQEAEVIDAAGSIPSPYSPIDHHLDEADRAALKLQHDKQDEFRTLANQIQATDPDAYQNLQGKNGVNRLAAAFIMAFYTWTASLFMALALAILALALLMVYAVVIGAPLAGIIGMHDRFRHVFKGVLNMFVAAVVGVVKLTLAAGVYAVVVSAIVAAPGNQAIKLLLTMVAAVVALMVVKPIKTFKTVIPGVDPHASMLRHLASYAVQHKAAEEGAKDAVAEQQPTSSSSPARVQTVSSTRVEEQSMDPIPSANANPPQSDVRAVLAGSTSPPDEKGETPVLVLAPATAARPALGQGDGSGVPATPRQEDDTRPDREQTPRSSTVHDIDDQVFTTAGDAVPEINDLPLAEPQLGADGNEVFVIYRTTDRPLEVPVADLERDTVTEVPPQLNSRAS